MNLYFISTTNLSVLCFGFMSSKSGMAQKCHHSHENRPIIRSAVNRTKRHKYLSGHSLE